MATSETPNPHVIGPVHGNTKPFATFETKAYSRSKWGDGSDTGGGYERWRSTEWRPHTPRREKEDVYVPLHRLSAVAWCYPDDMDISDILAHLDGRDVHHTTGEKWAVFGDSPNFDAPGLQVVGHGTHSEVTQAQMRAWAEDSKRQAQIGQVVAGDGDNSDGCAGCDSEDVFGTTESLDGEYCHACLVKRADGETIEVL